MSKYKRYERYKDSGIEWIGEIPEHWEVKKLKHISNITMGQSPKSEKCSLDEIGLPFLQGNAEFTSLHPIPKMYCNTANKFSKINDILLSVRAPVGAMNISDRVYGIGRGLCAVTANKVQVRYLWYSMNVSLEELFIKSKGSTFEAVTVTDVSNLLSILPPKKEQIAIANFLDHKTSEIDDLIADKEKLIELLQEKRQAIITETVTKGLNPNVRLKNSGIEWIGEIPEHWDIVKMKYLLSPKKYSIKAGPFGSQLKNDDMISGDVKVYNQRTVLDNDFNSGDYYIENYKYEELRAFEVFAGDILVTTRGTVGKTAIMPKNADRGILHPCLIKITLNPDRVCNEYVNIIFNSTNIVTNKIKLESNATTIDVIYTDTLKKLELPIPPLDEQKSIIDFINVKTAEIDGLISKIRLQIQKLKEYRQSLISEAVTGKIDVRDYAVE
ncbi:MAG: restriction endonuclease subunit S [Clostridia bacterium]|nr:restriction endonuclease subunit S [Clostridia bacterium]